MSRKAAATNRKRNASQEHKDALVMREQLLAYAAAHKEAVKNGTARPHISDYVK
jgi:hypothetical protein